MEEPTEQRWPTHAREALDENDARSEGGGDQDRWARIARTGCDHDIRALPQEDSEALERIPEEFHRVSEDLPDLVPSDPCQGILGVR
ncbi:MAG TPA: hypothetical protein VI893_08905 [Thermoplasmata archaeon]|nr:hypothetical protein [Thermoplasmata archaeon]